MEERKKRVRKRIVLWATLTASLVAILWCALREPGSLATAELRPDGLYYTVDVQDMPFDKICLAFAHYGSLALPIDCQDCTLSPAGKSLIAGDEDAPIRLVVKNGRVLNVFPVERTRETSKAHWAINLRSPDTCADAAISIAKCEYAVGEDCQLRFATFDTQ